MEQVILGFYTAIIMLLIISKCFAPSIVQSVTAV